jgi:hypothetical protein
VNAISPPWYVGSMNDCVFIINKPPRPSTDEVWHDRPDGPEVICKIGPSAQDEANAALIVSAVNAHAALVKERDQLKAALDQRNERFVVLLDCIINNAHPSEARRYVENLRNDMKNGVHK